MPPRWQTGVGGLTGLSARPGEPAKATLTEYASGSHGNR